MMRDDVLKRKMRAGRPEPTPEFSGSMRKALSALQKKAARPALPRLVPVSAVVFAAVAVLCVLALNNKTIMNFFAPGAPGTPQQLAAGGETTEPGSDAAARQTPCPTPTLGGTADDSGYYQKVGKSMTDNGITETLVEVAADPYMLYAKFEFGPVSEEVTGNAVTSEVGGKPSKEWSFVDTNPVKGKDGYYVTTYRLPLMGGAFGSNVTFNSQVEHNTTTPGDSNKILAHFKFDVSMDLWKPDSASRSAVGEGKLLFGYQAYSISLFQSPQDVAIHLALEDNKSGDLKKYFNKYIHQERGNGSNMVLFEPESPQMLNMLIYKGLADESDLDRLLSPVEGPEAKVVFDEAKGKLFLKYTVMLLERGVDGKYFMDIVCMNPALRADTNLSLISNAYVQTDNGPSNVKNSILQIDLLPENHQNATPNPSSAVSDESQDSSKPTPTPPPETTAMPSGESQAMQKLDQTSKDSGYELKLTEAGTDGYVLCMKTQLNKLPEGKCGYGVVRVYVNGKENTTVGRSYSTDFLNRTMWVPLTCRIDGPTADIELDYSLTRITGGSETEEKLASFRFTFTLNVSAPKKVSASIDGGRVAYNDTVKLEGVYQAEGYSVYSLKVTGNDDALSEYFKDRAGVAGSSADRVMLDNGDFSLFVCDGLVGKNYIDAYMSNDAMRQSLLVGDGDGIGHGVYGREIYAVLEKAGDGSFLLNIINLNPTHRPTGDFTIITKLWAYDDDGKVSDGKTVSLALQARQ